MSGSMAGGRGLEDDNRDEPLAKRLRIELPETHPGVAFAATSPEHNAIEDQFCFGTISGFEVDTRNCDSKPTLRGLTRVVFVENHSQLLVAMDDRAAIGRLKEKDSTLLHSLLDDAEMELEIWIETGSHVQHVPGKIQKRNLQSYTTLLVTIYGPESLYDQIGQFLGDHKIYLQDPISQKTGARYKNPHRLFDFDIQATTLSAPIQGDAGRETLLELDDFLETFESSGELLEAEPSEAIRTKLYKHQKEALTFMLRREQGWCFTDAELDLWTIQADNVGLATYRNNISGDTTHQEPPQFRGGILADHMGLGKTLSMIAFIAADIDPSANLPNTVRMPTLLIIPPSLLQTWTTELQIHLKENSIRWIEHYGNRKLKDVAQLLLYNLVITTPKTVSSEYRKLVTNDTPTILFSTHWSRIVLDEAHLIRNRQTITFKAICRLNGQSRWAMTGTPVQNRLADFCSLLEFLRIYPYSDHTVFHNDILYTSSDQQANSAVEKLRKLFNYIAIRRSKTTIDLPKRINLVQYLKFDAEEAVAYSKLESGVKLLLDENIASQKPQKGVFAHVMARMTQLRRFCNIGTVASNEKEREVYNWNNRSAQEAFENLASLGMVLCNICGVEDAPEKQLLSVDSLPQAWLTECLKLLCNDCHTQGIRACACPGDNSCQIASVTPMSTWSTYYSPVATPSPHLAQAPRKIRALVEELKSLTDEKRVVFSSWTTTFDIVGPCLAQEGILYVRVDGKVPVRNRTALFEKFRNDPSIKVLLLTILCGAEGLNLTVASRVYLMEPQWNPHVEEQALARVYRLGQKKSVETVRYVMKGTIEEDVRKIQTRKKDLVDVLHGNEKKTEMDRLKMLQSLFL